MGYAARASNGESPRELTDRKFKHVAAVTIDRHAGAIGHLVEAINQTNEQARVSREFVADLSVRIDELKHALATLEDPPADAPGVITRRLWTRHVELDNRVYRFESMGILARLRWLLTGK